MIESWRASHPAFTGASSEPAWLATLRRAALARFEATGLPPARDEAWRYTRVQSFGRTAWTHRTSPVDGAAVDAAVAPWSLPDAVAELVLVDGRIDATRSRVGARDGLSVGPLLTGASDAAPPHLGTLAAWQDAPFVALNTAFLQDGVVVRVDAKADGGLVHLVHVHPGGDGIVANPRVLVVLGTSSKLTLVETFVSAGGTHLHNAVTEVVVAADASLSHQLVGAPAAGTSLVLGTEVRVERDGRYHLVSAWTGPADVAAGGLVRHAPHVVLAGPGASARLDGLSVLSGEAHADNHIRVEHVAHHCTSRQTYKGVFAGRSRGVFDGTVVVHRGADGTDAGQESRNVLLSEHAEADAKPRLEIHTDDVRASHGTTVGRLDPDQLAYLRSRGIPLADARRLLTAAFVADVVEQVEDPALRERLHAHVEQQLTRVMES